MTMTPIGRRIEPTYAVLRDLLGCEVTATASPLDGYGAVALTYEFLSTPVAWGGAVTYSVRITGPVDHPMVPGRYELVHDDLSMVLALYPVAQDARFVHYEAYLGEPL
jgi:hypothetical protein